MSETVLQRLSRHETAPVLETERLILRPHRLEDFDALAAIFATDRSRFMGGPLEPADVWQMFSDSVGQWALLGCGTWAVDLRADGICVGEMGLNKPLRFPEPEMGWLVHDGFEGKGYATEAARAVLDFARAECDLPSLVSYIDAKNHGSIRVAERLGALRDPDAATPNDDACLVYRYRV